MPEYLATYRNAEGKKVTECLEADSADMSEKPQWQRQVETKMAAAAQRKQAIQQDHQRQMTEAERRWRRFGDMGDKLARTILIPRLTALASYFDNARLLLPIQSAECSSRNRPPRHT
jgi:hypothetical protein